MRRISVLQRASGIACVPFAAGYANAGVRAGAWHVHSDRYFPILAAVARTLAFMKNVALLRHRRERRTLYVGASGKEEKIHGA